MNDQSAQNDNHYMDYSPPYDQTDPVGPSDQSQTQGQLQNQDENQVQNMAQDNQSSAQDNQSQSIEDQNIFHLLGVTDGTDEQREEFLDELQQVIWEDFLENDLQLLVTTDEYTELQPLLQKNQGGDVDFTQQEELVERLEKLIPDLEEIMLEKALELKADLVRERIAGLKEYFASDQQALNEVNRAERMIMEDKWFDAAEVLNKVQPA